ncbi:MAG TPA: hypothetical protein VFB16_08710 [Bauldia sp.]|nr:hypothetical protein [Bauldia sp.]
MRRIPLAVAVFSLISLPFQFPATARAGAIAESTEPGFRAEAIDLKRDGSGGVTLTLRIYNDTDKEADLACEMRANGNEGCKQVSGIYLIDGANKKRHLVMRDSDGKCICTDTLTKVPAKGSVTVWAKFPEPPAEVKMMTAIAPLFLPLDGVPVTGP